jgi:hypothetical protein
MLAPPERRAATRTRKRKQRLTSARRLADRKRKRKQLERRKLGLHRCSLWLPAISIEGLIAQLIATGRLTDEQALDHRKFEEALALQLAAQGRRWWP